MPSHQMASLWWRQQSDPGPPPRPRPQCAARSGRWGRQPALLIALALQHHAQLLQPPAIHVTRPTGAAAIRSYGCAIGLPCPSGALASSLAPSSGKHWSCPPTYSAGHSERMSSGRTAWLLLLGPKLHRLLVGKGGVPCPHLAMDGCCCGWVCLDTPLFPAPGATNIKAGPAPMGFPEVITTGSCTIFEPPDPQGYHFLLPIPLPQWLLLLFHLWFCSLVLQ